MTDFETNKSYIIFLIIIAFLLLISCKENYDSNNDNKEVFEIKLYYQSKKFVPIHYSSASIKSIKNNPYSYKITINTPEGFAKIKSELDLLKPKKNKSEKTFETSIGGEIIYSTQEKSYWLIDVEKKLVEYNGSLFICSDSFLLYLQNLFIEDFLFSYTIYLTDQIRNNN